MREFRLLILLMLLSVGCRQSVDNLFVEIPTDQEEANSESGGGDDGEEDDDNEEEEEGDDDTPGYSLVVIDEQYQQMTCDWEGGTLAFEFWVSDEWLLTAIEPDDEWISFEQSGGEAGVVITTITIAQNLSREPREGKVKINNITTTTITQSACDDQLLDLDKERL